MIKNKNEISAAEYLKIPGKARGGRIRPRQEPGKMNRTEARYAQHLTNLKLTGQIIDFRYEPLKLRLAPRTYYTPDFLVITAECMEIHEVKGYWEDDARVKIKVAAEMFPWFLFKAIKYEKKEWKVEEF